MGGAVLSVPTQATRQDGRRREDVPLESRAVPEFRPASRGAPRARRRPRPETVQAWMVEMASADLSLSTMRTRRSTASSLCTWLTAPGSCASARRPAAPDRRRDSSDRQRRPRARRRRPGLPTRHPRAGRCCPQAHSGVRPRSRRKPPRLVERIGHTAKLLDQRRDHPGRLLLLGRELCRHDRVADALQEHVRPTLGSARRSRRGLAMMATASVDARRLI